MKKGLLVNVLRSKGGGATNGGVSSKYDDLLLVGEGVPEIFDEDEAYPTVTLIKHQLHGEDRPYLSVKPYSIEVHSMMGGNFIWSSDSRFPSRQPIAIHDRVE